MVSELIEFLNKRGFSCKESNGIFDCRRNDGLCFRLELKDKSIVIDPSGHEEELRELSSKEEVESMIIELQGIMSELKIISLKKGLMIIDRLVPFLEEHLEELDDEEE